MQWKQTNSPSTKNYKVTPSAGKFMFTEFRDSQGVLLAHFQKHAEHVNSVSHCEVLLKLRGAKSQKTSKPASNKGGYCFVMTVPDPIQPEQPRREFKNYSENFLNIFLTAWTWPLVTALVIQFR
jgi:hypothetical protein